MQCSTGGRYIKYEREGGFWGQLKNKQKPDEPGRIIQRSNFPELM